MAGKRILPVAFGLFILLIIIWLADPVTVVGQLAAADIRFIVLAFALSNVLVLLRVARWRVLLGRVGFSELFPVQLLGMTISNLTPGKIGEPAKALILKARSGIAVSESLPTIIWERITDVVILILLSFAAIQLVSSESKILMLGLLGVGLFAFMVVILLLVLYRKGFGMRLISLLRGFPLLKRIDKSFMEGFYRARIRKWRILASFLMTAAVWVLEGFVLYFCLAAINVALDPLILAGIIALSVIIGIASSLPGGIGSADAVMIVMLGLAGVESAAAMAGILLYRFLGIWYNIFIGGVSFLYLGKRFDLKKIIS